MDTGQIDLQNNASAWTNDLCSGNHFLAMKMLIFGQRKRNNQYNLILGGGFIIIVPIIQPHFSAQITETS